jgi:hypothetical protein
MRIPGDTSTAAYSHERRPGRPAGGVHPKVERDLTNGMSARSDGIRPRSVAVNLWVQQSLA